jgi:hypothetical protein
MWIVERLEIVPKTLDLTSSGQGRESTKALVADGVEIANALSRIEFGEPTQLMVCEACGIIHCSSGGWASFRRLGDGLVFVPAFAEMAEEDSAEGEHGPPHFMKRNGIPLLRGAALAHLRALPYFERVADLPPLSGTEAARIVQWEAPLALLGRFPGEPRLRREGIAAVNPGDDETTLAEFSRLLAAALASGAPVVPTDCEPVTFYLEEQRGLPEWTPLGLAGGELVLAWGDGRGFRLGAAGG